MHNEDEQPIYQPVPKRYFSLASSSDSPLSAFIPDTPPSFADSRGRSSDFLAQLNARLLRASQAQSGSHFNLTSSTLSGIFGDDDHSADDRSCADTHVGWGAQTPARASLDAGRRGQTLGSPMVLRGPQAEKNVVDGEKLQSQTKRQSGKPQRPWPIKMAILFAKLIALFVFGVVYGILVSHLHDSRELAAVNVEGVDRGNWTYLVGWGFAGLALGSLIPYVELLWGRSHRPNHHEKAKADLENETSMGEQVNDIVRSVGAFVGIAFAIRRLPWQSTLQLTLTLALVNPALWYILDRTRSGFSLSLIVTSLITSFIFLSDQNILPSPVLPAATMTPSTLNVANPNATRFLSSQASSAADGHPSQGTVRATGSPTCDHLAAAWIGSVVFCSCLCFASIGRRLAVWER